MADAIKVPLVSRPTYPYFDIPPIDDVMSLLYGKSISWGSDPRVISNELTKLNYLFFRTACHNIYPISRMHTIPIDRCIFLCALITDAPICFPLVFIKTIVEVYRVKLGHMTCSF